MPRRDRFAMKASKLTAASGHSVDVLYPTTATPSIVFHRGVKVG
jgi:RNA:NAD 2'-phosphotransferase (TPT1/KptA family)